MKAIVSLIATIATFLIFGFSCEDDKKRNDPQDGLIIRTGQECGWCAGRDSLSVTEIKTNYFSAIPCNVSDVTEIELSTNQEEWKELLRTFNWEAFADVEVNTCNLCSDGCDTWILVEQDDMVHQIRFGHNSPEIEPIRHFVEKLEALRQEFK